MKKNRFVTLALFTVLCAFMCTFSAFAEGEEYLFKLKSGADVPVSFLLCAEPQKEDILASELGIYKTDDTELIEYYKELGILEFCEENGTAELFDMPKTSDFPTASSGKNSLSTSYGQLSVNAFWSLGITGKDVRVGVVDSGISPHNDIVENLESGYNYYENNNNTTDEKNHGTLVAGFIAAKGSGYYGVAPDATVVSLKCFDSNGNNSIDAIARAITAAWKVYDCDVINMSFGADKNYSTLQNAVYEALENGVIMVAASGNHGSSTSTNDIYYYPASYDEVISVGNIQSNDVIYSSSGKNNQVTVVAPGRYVRGLSNSSGNMSYSYGTGTSFACPIVSGVVACMLEINPALTQSEVMTILQNTATDLGPIGFDNSYGYGKVNCEKIVKNLLSEKNYRSAIVEYNNTYNVALRNGLSSDYSSKLIFARYSGGKMTDIKSKNVSLASGESIAFSFAAGDSVKLFELDTTGYSSKRTVLEAE